MFVLKAETALKLEHSSVNSKRILPESITHQISSLPRNRMLPRNRISKRDGHSPPSPSRLHKINGQRNTFSAPLPSIINFPVLLVHILFIYLHKKIYNLQVLPQSGNQPLVLLDNVFFYLLFPQIH